MDKQIPEPKKKLVAAIAILCVFLMLPYVVNNFVQGRTTVGIASVLVVLCLVLCAVCIIRWDQYFPNFALFTLVPLAVFFLVNSIFTQGLIGVLWCFPAIFAFYIMLTEQRAWLANLVLLGFTLYAAYISFELPLFVRIATTLGLTSIFCALFINVINEQQFNLSRLATTDALTGLLNRTQLDEMLEAAVATGQRTSTSLSLLMIDLDHFKDINDDFGHAVGDHVLKTVADIVSTGRRQVDRIFRIGGEEFLVMLYGTGLENAKLVADRIRTKVEETKIVEARTVTVSIGVAELQPDESWKDWMKRSDKKLYSAKDQGRNLVVA